mgnify:CR=1 FL=1
MHGTISDREWNGRNAGRKAAEQRNGYGPVSREVDKACRSYKNLKVKIMVGASRKGWRSLSRPRACVQTVQNKLRLLQSSFLRCPRKSFERDDGALLLEYRPIVSLLLNAS